MASDLVTQAAETYKRGNRQGAVELLSQVVKEDSRNLDAWYGLAVCTQDNQQKIQYLLKVLEINQDHKKAKQALLRLTPQEVTHAKKQVSSGANSLGIISIVCGVIGLCVFGIPLGVVALACGIPAVAMGAESGIAGVILGIIDIILAICILIFMPGFLPF